MSDHWACLDLKYEWWYTEHRVVCISDCPCHLTLYSTSIPPRKHAVSRVLRGLKIPWSTYFCFVSYIGYEQHEVGDTTTHTFLIYDWQYLDTRWFCITGTIAGVKSLSSSPIFKHRRPNYLKAYHRNTSGYLLYTVGDYWTQHDSPVANWMNTGYPSRYLTGQLIPPNTLRVVRSAFFYDTTPLPPNCTLFDSRLVMNALRTATPAFDLVIVPGWRLSEPLVMADFGNILTEPSECARFDPLTFLGPNYVSLTKFGTQSIRRGAITAFGLLSSRDREPVPPTGLEYSYIYRTWDGRGYWPYLEVAWYPSK